MNGSAMTPMRRWAFALAAWLCAQQAWGAAGDADGDIVVRVDIAGEVVRVEAEAMFAASAREVWEVLTDFEHLPAFISNIASSKVLAREGNVVRVAQTGKTSFGPLTFEFQSEREFILKPHESFESRMISGNMKRHRGITQLDAVDGKTRLRHRSEAVPDTMLPLSLGRALIENETREHYREIRAEVLRRKNAAAPKPPPPAG